MDDIHLGFVTDGRIDHILGIANVLSQFATIRRNPRSVWVAAPTWVHDKVSEIVGAATPATLTYVDAMAQPDDPYAIQMSLGSIFQALPPSDRVWAIDHDHLVLGSSRHVPIAPGHVWASSERCFPYVRSTGARRVNWSVNVSFLAGRAGDLAAIATGWQSAHSRLSNTVEVRHRTEASFSWSAELSGIRLQRVPPTVQSNFDTRAATPFLFHYGGDTREARALKAELRRLASSRHPGCQAVHDRLVAQLQCWENARDFTCSAGQRSSAEGRPGLP